MKKNNKDNFAVNTSLYFISMVIPKIASLVMLPIYTRFISPEDFGIYSYTTAMIGVVAVFSSLGLQAFYLRNYAAELDKKVINGTLFWFLALWNVVLFCISILIIPIVMKIVESPFKFSPYMLLALATQFFHSMEIIPLRTFRIKGEVKYYLSRNLYKVLLATILNIIFVVIFKHGILGRYIAEFLTSIVFALVFIHYMKKNSYFRIEKQLIKRGLLFSLPLLISEIFRKFGLLFVNIITQKILSLRLLGIYSIGITLSNILQLVTNSIFLSIEPILYKRMYEPGFIDFFIKIKRLLIPIIGFVCVVSGVYVREISMILLSPKYWESWPVVQVISISYLIKVLNNLFTNFALVQKRTKVITLANMIYVIVSMVFSVIALPIWGENALGWSEVLGIFGSFLVLYIFVDKSSVKTFFLRRDFALIIFSLIILFISRIFHQYSLFSALILKTVLIIGYFLVILIILRITPAKLLKIVLKRNWNL